MQQEHPKSQSRTWNLTAKGGGGRSVWVPNAIADTVLRFAKELDAQFAANGELSEESVKQIAEKASAIESGEEIKISVPKDSGVLNITVLKDCSLNKSPIHLIQIFA